MNDIILKYLIWFIFYSFLGWVYESTLETISTKKLSSRGFLQGPYCPIYGVAAVISIYFFNSESSSLEIFLTGMIVATVLEYITSYVLEVLFHARWWEYSDLPLNINGRVCIIASAFFGVMMILLIKVIHNDVLKVTNKLNLNHLYFLAGAIVCGLVIDIIYTVSVIEKFNRKLEAIENKTNDFIREKAEKISDIKESITEIVKDRREGFILDQLELLKENLTVYEKRIFSNLPKLKSTEYTDIVDKLKGKRKGKYR